MIKFFRRIRKNLIATGKAKNYFLYAIGEIILVVIGILIALQINNWNEYRKDRTLEKEYLIRLKEDISFDIYFINRNMIGRYERKMKGLEKGKAYFQGTYVIQDTLQFLNDVGYGGVFGHVDWSLSKNTYNEIISTGNLRKIENKKLRNMINDYYESVNGYSKSSKNYISGYVKFINSKKAFNTNNAEKISDFDKTYLLKHLKTEEFLSLVNLEMTLGYRVYDWASNAIQDAENVLTQIDQELEN